jgi:hypothetical protein
MLSSRSNVKMKHIFFIISSPKAMLVILTRFLLFQQAISRLAGIQLGVLWGTRQSNLGIGRVILYGNGV